MKTEDNKKGQGKDFKKANFSCNLQNMNLKKEDFVKAYKGKLNTDINKLFSDIQDAKKAYFKTTEGKAFKANLKPEKGE